MKRKWGKIDGYLTVYMALTLTIVLSLCLTLIEGARQNAVFLEAECVTDIGLNSVLAEYHKELLAQFHMFAIDSSYGREHPQVAFTQDHLETYISRNLSREDVLLDWLLYRDFLGMKADGVSVGKVRYLTDGRGGVFRRRAAEVMLDEANLTLLQDLHDWMDTVESDQLTERDIAAEKKKLDKKLKSYDGEEKQISETEWITIDVTNPTDYLEKIRKKGILSWVVDVEKLSDKTLSEGNLISLRMWSTRYNQGNLALEDPFVVTDQAIAGSDAADAWGRHLERVLFQEYLMRYLGNYRNLSDKEETALAYQIEYILVGKESDQANLQGCVEMLFALREVSNTVYIFSDTEKRNIAKVLGTALASAMGISEAAQVVEKILLFGWAFAESIVDVKCLMAGGRVPLTKTSDSWNLELKNALKIKDVSSFSSTEGLSYEDYLRILLTVEKEDVLTVRAMDMVEADIRLTTGNSAFRIDGCIDALEACVHVESAYGYDCEITRQKAYDR